MDKLTRKELKTPDKIWQLARAIMSFLVERAMAVLIICAIVFLVFVGAVYYGQAKKRTEASAQYHYGLAHEEFERWKLEKAPEGKTEAETTLTKELETLEKEFRSTKANGLADYFRSQLALAKNDTAKALEYLEHYSAVFSGENRAMGLYPLAQAYEQAKDFEKSLKTYEKILGIKDTPYASYAWLGKARSLVQLKRGSEAVKAYETFLEKFPDSTEVPSVRGLLALAREAAKK